MKTLVIHPYDASTLFLKEIYNNKDWTVINDGRVSKKFLKNCIKEHDRIILLGHGNSNGLIDVKNKRIIVGSEFVYLLKDKLCIGIFCYANLFFKRYKLKGFYTGMFISEISEALEYYLMTNKEEIDESNITFAELMSKYHNDFDSIIKYYRNDQNVVQSFNRERLGYNV